MIDKADAEHGPNSRKIARRPQIFRTGRGITARMIMRNDHRRCIGGKSRGENLSQRQVDEALFARPCAHGAGLAFGIQEQGADMFAALVAEKRPKQLKRRFRIRSEEHTSELQSLMRISYAVFCLKKKKIK